MLNLDLLSKNAEMLYQKTEEYEDDESQVKILANEIKVIMDITTRQKKSEFFSDGLPKQVHCFYSLNQMIFSIEELINIFEQYKEKNVHKALHFIKKFIKESGYKETFEEIDYHLINIFLDLNLESILHGFKQQQKYEEARRADIARFRKQMEGFKSAVSNILIIPLIDEVLSDLSILSQSVSSSFPKEDTPHILHVKSSERVISAPHGIRGDEFEIASSATPSLVKKTLESRGKRSKSFSKPALDTDTLPRVLVKVEKTKSTESYSRAYLEGDRFKIKDSSEVSSPLSSPVIIGPQPSVDVSHMRDLFMAGRITLNPTKVYQITPDESQLKLQDQLITACKQGKIDVVCKLLKNGAKPHIDNRDGVSPLCAAIWGMTPEIVALLYSYTSKPLKTWEECRDYNLGEYNQVFLIEDFNPNTFDKWEKLVEKIDSSVYLQEIHRLQVACIWQSQKVNDWKKFRKIFKEIGEYIEETGGKIFLKDAKPMQTICQLTELKYRELRIKIQKIVKNNDLGLTRSFSGDSTLSKNTNHFFNKPALNRTSSAPAPASSKTPAGLGQVE